MFGEIAGAIAGQALGGLFGGGGSSARKEAALQKEFAQNGIQWKVADAKAAGVHPIYALGAPTTSYSPQAVGGSPWSETFKQAGASLGRLAGSNSEELADDLLRSQIEGQKIDNQIKKSEFARLNSAQSVPVRPAAAVAAGDVVLNSLQRTKNESGSLAKEVGSLPDFTYVDSMDGSKYIVPSKDAKERIEDQLIPELSWAWRNNILPIFGQKPPPPSDDPGEGRYWRWDGFKYTRGKKWPHMKK